MNKLNFFFGMVL